ncbi:sac3 ganp family protein [Stylonychia lemnae]|uniref:Sac3 ganp family protein n=1 Tax=Stylonychia lemnae TaxID=5949 RepID=A0A078AWL3_STYLE|nr:sac3 ganp family protein [Stylonychia lemnae]|eukprot:CDW85642.1 sac3 ganp family protein [Stylonychia lemnae]
MSQNFQGQNNAGGGGFGFGAPQNASSGFLAFQVQSQSKIQPNLFNVNNVKSVIPQVMGSKPKQNYQANQPKQSSSNIFAQYGGPGGYQPQNQQQNLANQQQQMQGGGKKSVKNFKNQNQSQMMPQTQQNQQLLGKTGKPIKQSVAQNNNNFPFGNTFPNSAAPFNQQSQSQSLNNTFGQNQGFNQFNQPKALSSTQPQNNKTLGQHNQIQKKQPYKKQGQYQQSQQPNDMQMDSPLKGNQQQSQNSYQSKFGNQGANQLQVKKANSVITKHINQNQPVVGQKQIFQTQKKQVPTFIQGKSGSQQPKGNQLDISDTQMSIQPQETISSHSNISKPSSLATSGNQSLSKFQNKNSSNAQAAGGINITNQNKNGTNQDSKNSSKQRSQGGTGTQDNLDEDEQQYDDEDYDDEYYDHENYYEEEGQGDLIKEQKPKNSTTHEVEKPQQVSGQKVCKSFLYGTCKFGAKCRDQHQGQSKNDAHSKAPQKPICQFFLKNSCTYGDKCKNSHEIDPQSVADIAKNLLTSGNLPKGFDAKKMQQLIEQTQNQKSGVPFDEDYYDEEEEPEEEIADNQDQEEDQTNPITEKLPMGKIAELNKGKVISLQALKDQNAKLAAQEEEKKSTDIKKPIAKKSLNPMQSAQKTLKSIDQPQEINKPLLIQQAPKSNQNDNKIFAMPTVVSSATITKRRQEIIDELKKIQSNPQSHLIRGKAELLAFCSDQEIQSRSEIDASSASKFERDRQGQGFPQYAIKAYSRSAADKVMNEVSEIRPPIVLYKIIEYLRDCIADQDMLGPGNSTFKWIDPSFGDIYSFIRDRGRCVALDFIIIDQNTNQYYIKSLEELSRFLLMSYHDGFTSEVFDTYQNTQILTKNLGSLKNCYEQVELDASIPQNLKKEMMKNKIEFLSYLLIASSKDSVITRAEIASIDILAIDPKDYELMKQAIKINSAIQNGDATRYFKLLNSKDINYLFKCMMINFLNEMRLTLIEQIVKGFNNGLNKGMVELDFMQKVLKFIDSDDTAEFLEAAGFTQVGYDQIKLSERKHIDQWKEKVNIWRQKNRLTFLDEMRGIQPRSFIMKNGVDSEDQRKRAEQLKIKHQQDQEKKQKEQKLLEEKNLEKQKIEKEKQEIEKKKQIEKELQMKAIEEKESLEREAKEKKEREEKERIMREIEEKKRQEKIAHEKKMKLLKKFQTIGIKYREIKENNKYAQMRKEFLEFGRSFKKLLGKRKDRDMVQELETQIIEMFQQEAFIPIQNREQIYKTLSSLDLDFNQIQTFKMKDWISQVIPERQGHLQLKLISSRIRPNNKPEQLWEILQILILLFNNSLNPKLSNTMLKSQYNTDINDELSLAFKYEEIEKLNEIQKQNLFLETNLIMLLTDSASFEKDLKFIKEQLKLYPQFSRLNFLIMIYGNDYSELQSLQDKLNMALVDDLSCHRVLNLQIIPLCFHIPARKKTIPQLAYPQTLRALILAYLLRDLEKSLLKSKIFNDTQQKLIPIQLSEILQNSLVDITPVIEQVQEDNFMQYESFYKKFFQDLQVSSGAKLYELTKLNEIQILNFWFLTLNQLLQPVIESLQDSIQMIVLTKKKNAEMSSKANKVLDSLKLIQNIERLKNFTYPTEYDKNLNADHVNYLIQKEFKKANVEIHIISKIENIISYLFRYKSIQALHKNRSKLLEKLQQIIGYFKASQLFQQLFMLLFSEVNETHISYLTPKKLLSLQDVDYEIIQNKLQKLNSQGQNTLLQLKQQFPLDFKEYSQPQILKQTKRIKGQYAVQDNSILGRQISKIGYELKTTILSEKQIKEKNDLVSLDKVIDEYSNQTQELYSEYKEFRKLRRTEVLEDANRSTKRIKQDKFDIEQSAKFLQEQKKILENMTKKAKSNIPLFVTRSQVSKT